MHHTRTNTTVSLLLSWTPQAFKHLQLCYSPSTGATANNRKKYFGCRRFFFCLAEKDGDKQRFARQQSHETADAM